MKKRIKSLCHNVLRIIVEDKSEPQWIIVTGQVSNHSTCDFLRDFAYLKYGHKYHYEKIIDSNSAKIIGSNSAKKMAEFIVFGLKEMMLLKRNTENKDIEAVVIIDNLGSGLHPVQLKKYVEDLTKLLPKVKFVASTHNPIVFLGLPKDSVIINLKPSDGIYFKAEKINVAFHKLTPNAILTSPIFGFDDIFSNETTADEVETADRYSVVEGDKSLRETLDILKRTDEDFFNDLMQD